MTEVADQVMGHIRNQSMNGAENTGVHLGKKVNFNS